MKEISLRKKNEKIFLPKKTMQKRLYIKQKFECLCDLFGVFYCFSFTDFNMWAFWAGKIAEKFPKLFR